MTGYWVHADARIFNCAYFNNWRFEMDNPTVFRHERGALLITGGRFSKNSPNATLYAPGSEAGHLTWRDNRILAFAEAETKALADKLSGENADTAVAQHLAG